MGVTAKVVEKTGTVRADGGSGHETLATMELAYEVPGFEVITPVS
jgi:uncharacterized membrane protein